MKKYVFLIPSLSNMGGAQMYVRNKMNYLLAEGWVVTVVSAQAKNVIIPELKEFNYIFPEVAYYKFLYSNKKQKRIVDNISKIINRNSGDIIVVESATLRMGTWGESIAKQVKAKHLLFLLQEKTTFNNRSLLDFLVFKHKRKELVGITKQSLTQLFKPYFQIRDEESYSLIAHCNNVEADVDCEYLHQIDKTCYDYIVGGVSRLDKAFVENAFDDFCQYAINKKTVKFLLLWIGDAPKNSRMPIVMSERIKNLLNVDIIITGYLYPVPTRLLEMCDALISSAGSSWVCMRSGVPTITYDGNDLRPIGVLGHTTQCSLFRQQNDNIPDFNQLMNDILIEKKIGRTPANYTQDLPDFKSHMDFLNQSSDESVYFDIDSIRARSIKERIIKLIGPQRHNDFCMLLKSIKKHDKSNNN